VPAYANFSDLYRASPGRPGRRDTRAGLRAVPGDATLLHLSGLQRVRAGDSAAALDLLRRASRLAPDNARFAYVYAVALHSTGQPGAAMAVLEQALQHLPYAPELLSAAAAFEREAGHTDLANRYLQRYAPSPAGCPDALAVFRERSRTGRCRVSGSPHVTQFSMRRL